MTPSVSVVICAYTELRWDDMRAAVASVLAQTPRAHEVLLIIDNNPELLARARTSYCAEPLVRVLPNAQAKGLSGARNTGILAARGEIVAFLDDDAGAESEWLAAMVGHYADGAVAGVGGRAEPRWPQERPTWLPAEFDWVVGCSYVGQPTSVTGVRNFIGANMSLRRDILARTGGFSHEIGRIGTVPLGCEETELCIRVRDVQPGATLLYDPAMRVRHRVTPDRIRLRYFVRRCYHEGLSKAVVAGRVGADAALSSERDYTRRVLPRAVLRGLRTPASGGLLRAAAVLLGLAVTTLGYLRGRLRAHPRQRIAPWN
ncbi:glycosyltransferase family 2 protein [Nocardia panacis]|uniref:Glycosyltransferase family 2 protein n=1 Tax=Nocardia panacis TaxID=2340916 RepID=A0A3A4KKC0_9NOCA|nr:glycosyltransferase family 2 protein [Nocardia panacis]RJO73427.1 glycosyltransferase family 2 protein [Nocardia panacis]